VPITEPQPRYQQIADVLREAIERGDYAPGSTLEPELTLAERHNVNKRTVNMAIRLLRADGLVHVERGARTVVRELPVLRRDASARQRIREQGQARGAFQAELERLGIEAHSNVSVSEQIAPDDVAELLGIDPATPALARRRHMLADHTPVQLATSWLPMDLAAGTPIAEVDTGPGGIYSRLADLGHGPAEFTETIRLRLPDPDERTVLRMDVEQRVYAIRRTAADADGRIVEVNDMVLPAHQWELVYTWEESQLCVLYKPRA